jgi:hypothetical protein
MELWMDAFDEVSYCGLDCGSCEIGARYRASLAGGEKPEFSDLPSPLREHIAEAPLICLGCRTGTLFEGCRRCDVRQCASKREVPTCYDCPDWPCALVESTRTAVARLRKHMPHVASILRESRPASPERRRIAWSCPDCGTPFTWYADTCPGCGRSLVGAREYESFAD